MDQIGILAVAIVVAAIVSLVVFMLGRRANGPVMATSGMPEDAERVRVLEEQLTTLAKEKEDVARRLAVADEKTSRIAPLEKDLISRQADIDALKDAKAEAERTLAAKSEAAAQSDRKIDELTHRISGLEDELNRTRKELSDLQTRHATLQESLEQERKQAEEKLALLKEAREQLGQQFEVLAAKVMKENAESFNKQSGEHLGNLLDPLKTKIGEFQQGLLNAHVESAKQREALATQINSFNQLGLSMSKEAKNLTEALKGKAQTQGAWGEMILSTILERSGLRKGEEYVTQESHTLSDGARLRPDVVVNLPNAEKLIIDSKVSLVAFESYVNAGDESARATALKQHLTSMRGHITELAAKEYQNVVGTGIDFVIMFVPIEGALAVALQEDPALTTLAAEKHVAIATPTTLMMALKTIGSLWQIERRNQNAEAIALRAGKLYDKFVGFVGDLKKVGDRLDQAQSSYTSALGKLSSGRGNIVGQIEQLKDMGARSAKALPAELLTQDEADEPTPALTNMSA